MSRHLDRICDAEKSEMNMHTKNEVFSVCYGNYNADPVQGWFLGVSSSRQELSMARPTISVC